MSQPVRIIGPFIAKYEGWCLSSGDKVNLGERICMVKGVGVWHDECGKPRSLAMYAKEAVDRPRQPFHPR